MRMFREDLVHTSMSLAHRGITDPAAQCSICAPQS